MNRKNLLIAGILICAIIVLSVIGVFIIMPSMYPTTNFDNSTPESTAVSIARLNSGSCFDSGDFDSVYLTPDGKYWIVTLKSKEKWNVTIDAKTLMSKQDDGEWKSLDELKACYIADIQICSEGDIGKPHEITMESKKIWKVPVYFYNCDENGSEYINQTEYIYVDLATGKSKSTWDKFNKFAGTNGWLTLKQIDNIINRRGFPGPIPFRNALGDLYPQ